MNDEIKGLVERLEQCLDGWCSIISGSDGTTGFAPPRVGPGSYQWIEQVTEEAAAALALSDEARVRAERERDEAWGWTRWLVRQASAEGLDDKERLSIVAHFPADGYPPHPAEALVRELVEGLTPFATGFLNRDVWTDDVILEVGCFNAQANAKFAYPGLRVGDFRKAQALILRAEGEGSSVAESAAPVASQPGCSAAQSLDGGEG